MELTNAQTFLVIVCLCGLFVITTFFYTETVNQERYSNNLIKACNISRNQIADDYDFNLIEYDQNNARTINKDDFNIWGGLNVN